MKIYRIIGTLLLTLLLAACNSNDDEGAKDGCYLTFYVYSPGNPIATRADVKYQDATSDENAIRKLQLWVFKHSNGELVGYLEQANVTLSSSGSTFRMLVDQDFADHPVNVDVYAVANVSSANAGQTFTRTTTRAQLDAAKLQGGYFFGTQTSSLVQNVPADGLPMTGILTDQPVAGSYPALRVGTIDEMATVRLVRSLSKLRFLIVRANDADDPTTQLDAINSISINGEMIPTEEYLMLSEPHDNSLNPLAPLGSSRLRIGTAYEPSAINFGAPATEDIRIVDMDTWTYEEHPNDPLVFGLTYLRESNKKLAGTIKYRVKSNTEEEKSVDFEMTSEGDFTRNHSWNILVMFVGGQVRLFNVVDIGVAEWKEGGSEDHEVYNW